MQFEDMINTIQLGDCYELIKNIPDKSIDLIYTDIPYEYESGGKGGSSFIISDKVKETYHEKIDKFAYGIDYKIFDELCRIMKHIFIYIWCSKEQIHDIMNYFIDKKIADLIYLYGVKLILLL